MVFVIHYRKSLINEEVFEGMKTILKEIEERYYIKFNVALHENNHLHLLVEARLRYSPSEIMQICKSVTAKQIFNMFPNIKEELWGGHFWTERRTYRYCW